MDLFNKFEWVLESICLKSPGFPIVVTLKSPPLTDSAEASLPSLVTKTDPDDVEPILTSPWFVFAVKILYSTPLAP